MVTGSRRWQRLPFPALPILAALLGACELELPTARTPASEPRPTTAVVTEVELPPATEATLPPAPQGLAAEESARIALFRRASPSVVYITSLAVRRDYFSMNVMQIPRGSGSGFIWDEQGHIVTNYHVIADADVAQVTLADHSTWDAQLVGVGPSKDLAVLRIDAPRELMRPLPRGESRGLLVGQTVLAIGNPFGLDQTLTTGIISALGREIESQGRTPIRDVIQTDAAINPGNSGGPLLDSAGRLIGVNTAIFSPSGAYAGIGFAIPVDAVSRVVPDLITHGHLSRPSLGITTAPAQLQAQIGLDDGVLVIDVVPGSGADRAGIAPTRRDRLGRVRLGDVIVGLDGEPVHSDDDLLLLLEQHREGERVEVRLRRGREEHTVDVVLGTTRDE